MALGKINFTANDGAIVGAYVTDGLGSGDRVLSFGPNLSGITAYHLLQGNLAVSASTITQGFNTTLYTGNGSTQSITTGIDMSTQWGNTVEEKFGGLVWIKGRSIATGQNLLDSVRSNFDEIIYTHSTSAGVSANVIDATSTGFNIGTVSDTNNNGVTYASWNFQTTHRITGITNHGKPYTCHYNPFTGFTMVKYTGSGIAGHEIPHMLGRKLGIYAVKQLNGTNNWVVQSSVGMNSGLGDYLNLNNTVAVTNAGSIIASTFNNDNMSIATTVTFNAASSTYIMYGWANSYFDKSNKLIGNYEIGVYQGTGASGNKVTTRGKPAWTMIKRLDSTGYWVIGNNQMLPSYVQSANTANAQYEWSAPYLTYNSDGFTVGGEDVTYSTNASGGQYLYMVAYDTNANGGGTYYPKSTDSAQVQVNNALIPLAKGYDSNGVVNSIVVANETITGVTWSKGKNYPYKTDSGYGVSKHSPQYNNSYNGFGDYYDVNSNKWYKDVAVFSDDFSDNNASDWTPVNCTLSVNNGIVTLNGTVPGAYAYKAGISVVRGKKYRAILDARSSNTDNSRLVLMIGSGQYQEVGTSSQGNGTLTMDFITTGTTIDVIIAIGSIGTATFDNYTIIPLKDNGDIDLSNATEITESRNYLNHIVYADSTGNPLYVEELPKTRYEDVIKANEYQGKNACTAWVNFDGTTTPPKIRDSYNVSAVIRTSAGTYDVYFKEPMDNVSYGVFGTSNNSGSAYGSYVLSGAPTGTANDGKYLNKVTIGVVNTNALYNPISASVEIKGGKN